MNVDITKFIKEGWFQTAVITAGVIITAGNIYLAFKLAPFRQEHQIIISKVNAVEDKLIGREELIREFVIVKSKVEDLRTQLIRIEDKLDQLK